ncbi:Potassium channel AKT1 [Madurella mycetomatis]|uniref:Potassium channel AKT1 n=1 Tax=Madurella mycetomatis TaxID=100816 RepID=A0A175WF53_9PEZI|nr:Potassium channel AKT1 [Madurella mycetomatis]
MSFGVGVGDLALVPRSAWRLYKACKQSSEDFARLSTELLSLHAVLSETHDFLMENPGLDTSRHHRLSMLCSQCNSILEGLESIVARYESLGTQAQRTWDRMRFGLSDLSEIRERLVSSITLLTAFNTAMINASTARIEKKLNKFFAEVQAGLREGSVVTTENVAHTIETADVWAAFRREIEDVGISVSAAEENHEFILEKLRAALAEGALDEQVVPSDNPTQRDWDGKRPSPVPPSDSGYGSTVSFSARGSISSSIGAANQAFEEELRRQRTKWQPGTTVECPQPGSIAGPMTSDLDAAGSSLLKMKRSTRPVRLVKKWFVNGKAIIQAASDGDAERVAELISLGVDVNARERWGWSALSMCGYSGNKTIARMLLDHGADLDNVDVDGDTPTSLATQRGHAELVIMFDEERAVRDLKIRESDKETPRK